MYNEFFGLNRSPFDLSPDPSFLFASEKTRDALASISYAVNQRKGFVVMTGEVGTGKTLILRCLFELWEREQIPFAYFIGPRLSTIDFLGYITSELGIKVAEPTKGSLLRALYAFLLAQFESGLTTVLVIDEAHQVPRSVLEEIRLLTNFETAQQKLVQILLVGQPELDHKLDSFELRSLKQRIAMRCQLEPLGEQETVQYIQRRLELAGAHSGASTIFSAESLNAIYRYSQGIPRLVNTICDQALLAASARQRRVVSAEIIDEAACQFRLYPAGPQVRQMERRPSPASQIQRSAPKSWPVLQASGPHHIPSQGAVGPGTIPEALTDLVTHRALEEATDVNLPSEMSPLSDEAPSATTPSQAHASTSPQESRLEAESTFPATATPFTIRESVTGPTGRMVDRVSGLRLTHPSDRILLGPSSSPIRSSWERLFRLPRRLGKRLQAAAKQWPGVFKKALFISAGAALVIGLATGAITAHRQNRGVAVHQAATWTILPAGETDASTQPVATSPARASSAALDSAAQLTPGGTSNGGISKPNAEPEPLPSQKKIELGALSKPVVRSSPLPNSAEPPPLTGTQTNELGLDQGLLDTASSAPGPLPPRPTAGGHVQAPKLISSPPPIYPSQARMDRVEGVVVIDALVDETGRVADMKVVSGPLRLVKAAMNALSTWKYEPARLNDQPIATHTQVNIKFALQ